MLDMKKIFFSYPLSNSHQTVCKSLKRKKMTASLNVNFLFEHFRTLSVSFYKIIQQLFMFSIRNLYHC
jgi:hypothetical protein